MPARTIIDTIARLRREHGTPPFFAKVCNTVALTPMLAVKALQNVAHIGW
jgi:hypothetical protein